MTAEWNAGYVRYLRDYSRDNQNSPFFDNFQGREEDYHQWSTELRVNSPLGGMFEWVVGAFYQIGDLDVYSSSLGAHVRRAQRFNRVWEDQEWKSLFGVLTFNFLDNRASIDLGARYSDLYKETFGEGYGAQWVFDVRPCRASADDFMLGPAGTAADEATCLTHPSAVQITMADNPRIYDPQADLDNLWAIRYDRPNSQQGRDTPPNWRGSRAHAVGLTAPDFTVRPDGGPWLGNFSSNRVDPQIVLRYRPTDGMSFYARWAKAYKAGGFDTGQTSLPTDIRGYVFGPEYAETYEGGVKGSFLDGRGRYDANLFNIEFTDLQLSVSTPNPDDPFANINAGAQRVRGIEVGTAYAFSDRLLASLNGAFLDGVMSEFPNAPCTETELENAPASGCDPDTELIDRSGQSAPNTPDWKFVADLQYWMPVPGFDQHKLTFNTRFYMSDGYCDTIGDCGITRWETHGDANASLSLGDMADVWELTAYVKNLFHPTAKNNYEGVVNPDLGIETPSLTPSRFMSYGLRLRYNFF
jgi:outer membrane receptor protein involved in Fe transport